MSTSDDARDLTKGIAVAEFGAEGMVRGRIGDDEVLVVKSGDDVFTIGAQCTHYKGPLADGLIVGDTVRCPWHHACFSLRTGEAVRAPAFDPVACWNIEQRDGKLFVTGKKEASPAPATISPSKQSNPKRIVIVGGGAAGFAAAEM